MRRVWTIVRRPAAWLAVLLFVAWTWFFHVQVTPSPRFVVATGAKEEWAQFAMRPTGT